MLLAPSRAAAPLPKWFEILSGDGHRAPCGGPSRSWQ